MIIGLGIGIPFIHNYAYSTFKAFDPSTLFANGEQGAWYDPSDLSTLYQDAAGTTPVTAVEQPVGLMLDKSKGLVLGPEKSTATLPLVISGTSVGQKSSISAPDIGKTYLLTYTITNSTLGAGTDLYIEPSNSGFSYRVLPKTVGTYRFVLVAADSQTGLFSIGGPGPFSGSISIENISVRELPGNHAFQTTATSRPVLSARVNRLLATETLATQTVTTLATTQRLRFEGTGSITLSGTGTGTFAAGTHTVTTTAGTLTVTVSGSVLRADLREANNAIGSPDYQRVNTETDYDTVGFPHYLKFDGVDDFMQVSSFTLPLINRTVVLGFAENAVVANQGCVSVYPAIGSDWNSSQGFAMGPSNRTSERFTVIAANGYQPSWIVSPNALISSSVMTEDKIAGLGTLRVNGAVVGTDNTFTEFSATSTGGLLIGARWLSSAVSASNRLNGRIYSLIIRGVQSTPDQITKTEAWMAAKTGVTL